MNKKIIWIVVLILIVLLFVIYIPKTKAPENAEELTNNSVATTTNTTPTTPTTKKSVTSTNTFKSIFNQPGSHTCSYDKITPEARTNVIIYIADGKMRAEFRTITANKTTSNIMVYNSGILYVWTEGMLTGTKNPLSSVSDLPFIIPNDLTSGGVVGTGLNSVSWFCHAWSKDSKMLTPPTTIKFK